jgi:hypothetical protein
VTIANIFLIALALAALGAATAGCDGICPAPRGQGLMNRDEIDRNSTAPRLTTIAGRLSKHKDREVRYEHDVSFDKKER